MATNLTKRLKQAKHILISGRLNKLEQRDDILPITQEEIDQIKQFFPLPKFFIFGHARSGTTLLARLVRIHPAVHCNWQGHFFTRPPFVESLVNNPEVGTWLSRRSNRWNQGGDLSALVLRGTCDLILEREAYQLGKTIVGDKSPNSLVDGEAVHKLAKVYPDAKLVYIVRDGRDAVLSHRFQSFIDATQHLVPEDLKLRKAFIENPDPFLHGERSIFTPKGIHQAAAGWVRNVTETNKDGIDLFKNMYHSMKFEDLTLQPQQEMFAVWSFLGADVCLPELPDLLMKEFSQNPDADWQYKKANQIAQSLQKGKSGSWREMFTSHDRQVFHEIAGDTLQQWGYPAE
jgi:hypothetical protein